MQKDLLFLIFILKIAFAQLLFGQNIPNFVRFDPPSFVPENNSFITSLIFKSEDIESDNLVINFKKPKSLEIISVYLRNKEQNRELQFSKLNSSDQFQIFIKPEDLLYGNSQYYQILLNCYISENTKINKQSFIWLDKKNSDSEKTDENFVLEDKIEEIQIYESQKTAGNSLQFNKLSQLNLNISGDDDWINLYTEFWIKSDNNLNSFFNIRKSSTRDTLVSLSKNEYGFITFPLKNNELVRKDIYLGEKGWNYIGILLKRGIDGLKSEVFVNSKIAYSAIIENDFNINNLKFNLNNKSDKNKFEIDRLKIWKFANSIKLAQHNKHFLSYDADSSQILYQSNFDNVNEFSSEVKTKNLEIISNNLLFAKSNAPLFSKAPKLTVNIGSNYNSIVWYVQEYSIAEEFIIERAIGENEYKEVYKTLADDDPLKIYYFTDELFGENEVTYYRVKQINSDKSEVYSVEVKIGNKSIQEFNLSQNYPNPFNPITSIYVEVIFPSELKVNVYDLVGNNVGRLHDGFLGEGMHTFEFDGSKLPSGIYFYEVISPKSQVVKKMILAK